MPSTPPATDGVPRRWLLAGLGAAGAASLAGCAGRAPGTAPSDVDAAETDESGELVWQYPEAAVDSDSEGIGYASVSYEDDRPADGPGTLQFRLNTTVGSIAASEEYADYEADWTRFRLGPPTAYAAAHQFEMWVRPPSSPEVIAGYEHRAGRRELVVELREIDTGGTITLPVVFDPVDEQPPERFHCSFTAQASEPGVFGEVVRASGRGVVDVAAVRES